MEGKSVAIHSCVPTTKHPKPKHTSFHERRTPDNCALVLLDTGAEGDILVGANTLARFLKLTGAQVRQAEPSKITYRFGAGSKQCTRTVKLPVHEDFGGILVVDVVDGDLPFIAGYKFLSRYGLILDPKRNAVFKSQRNPGQVTRVSNYSREGGSALSSLWLSLEAGFGQSLSGAAFGGVVEVPLNACEEAAVFQQTHVSNQNEKAETIRNVWLT